MEYIALMIDLKDSRRLEESKRVDCQNKLFHIKDLINIIFKTSLVKEMVFSQGDSMQGLFTDIVPALYAYHMMKTLVYPYTIRCGIGKGNILETMPYADSNMNDGIAYHKAKGALDLCKERNVDILLDIHRSRNYCYNQLLHVIMMFQNQMTKTQQDIQNIIDLLIPLGYETMKDHCMPYDALLMDWLNKQDYQYAVGNVAKLIAEIRDMTTTNNVAFSDQTIYWFKAALPSNLPAKLAPYLHVTRVNIRQIIDNGNMEEIIKLWHIILNLIEEGK